MVTRLLLVDDHAVVRYGLRMLLASEPDLEIVGEADTAEAAIRAAAELQPDVVLMDIGLPDVSGIEATRRIRAQEPSPAVVALTIYEDEEYFFMMLEAGASGYVPKRAAPHELVDAIRTAAAGEVYLYPSLAKLLVQDFITQGRSPRPPTPADGLSAREEEVLALLGDSAGNDAIGDKLGISPKTVARHRENIMRKLGLRTRTDLVKYAIRRGIIRA